MGRLRLAFALLVSAAGAASAAEERMAFDIRIGGIKAGELEIAGRIENGRYSLAGRLQSTGLVAAIRKVRYDVRARGTFRDGTFMPRRYTEITYSGNRNSEAEMLYRSGVPQGKTYTPARKPDAQDVDPATQGGTLDPLSAMFAVLRARDADRACEISIRTFDGEKAARVGMERIATAEDEIICQGAYVRVAGFDAEEMADRRVFPFRLSLSPGSDGLWRVSSLELQSLYGRAQLVRR